MKDFTESKDQRFKIVGSKNFQNIVEPSKFLHLSNISESIDGNYICQLFKPIAEVKSFEYFIGNKKMAVTQFETLNDAVSVLMNYHNHDINGRYLF